MPTWHPVLPLFSVHETPYPRVVFQYGQLPPPNQVLDTELLAEVLRGGDVPGDPRRPSPPHLALDVRRDPGLRGRRDLRLEAMSVPERRDLLSRKDSPLNTGEPSDEIPAL